ncbi:MAG TPA: hypothetical protein PKO42_00860 [Tenuifilaceae bacterium]|jgi:hypothetical protein|nr:hypothetical protein [Tenuifilaceae bacterium]HOC36473.1 hypothetical protein [Tenuifilaceae bacterium]HOW20335.1 hypothetical protein [Tenuifilaceae bacterium]HOY72133.1 hypothetical protein [Tenuifilaceae bacterium]HPA66816.1 hypothetical protein [Tenuifilaceae bacterium]
MKKENSIREKISLKFKDDAGVFTIFFLVTLLFVYALIKALTL